MYRLLLLVAFLSAMLFAGGLSPLPHRAARMSQEATPAITFPVTPDPAQCTVAPRSVDSLVALLGTPAASQVPITVTHTREPEVIRVPIGQPANAEVEAGITATVYELQACFNAGDSRRAFALTTDDFLQAFTDQGALTAEDIAFLIADSAPTPEKVRPALVAVTDISVLPDGRAGAFVITDTPFTGPDTVYMIFVQQGERWLVDEIIGFL